MQATSSLHQAEAPPAVKSRSFKRAFADVREAWDHRELWGHLGWQDIKQRYRRSIIGPLWITISMGTTALALGLLYSVLFSANLPAFLPYVTAGFIIWNFILGCVTEGTDVFIANEGIIKHLPAPITIHVMRMVWRQVLFLAHNMVIYVIVVLVFIGTLSGPYKLTPEATATLHPGISWTILLAIPGLVLLALNAVWVSLLFGVISTRFRDIPPVVNSFINLVFFMTPIMWDTDILRKVAVTGSEGGADWRVWVAELNPVYHFVEIVRAPLLGHHIDWHHWAVVGGFTVIGWFAALVILRNYRARVSYWV